MKYWNGSCWKEHVESPKVLGYGHTTAMIEATREEVEHAKANPLNLTQLMRDDYEAAKADIEANERRARVELGFAPDDARAGHHYDRQTLGRYVPFCDWNGCIKEQGHAERDPDDPHVDSDGKRLRVSIAERTEQQRLDRTIGPIRMDARPDVDESDDCYGAQSCSTESEDQ